MLWQSQDQSIHGGIGDLQVNHQRRSWHCRLVGYLHLASPVAALLLILCIYSLNSCRQIQATEEMKATMLSLPVKIGHSFPSPNHPTGARLQQLTNDNGDPLKVIAAVPFPNSTLMLIKVWFEICLRALSNVALNVFAT